MYMALLYLQFTARANRNDVITYKDMHQKVMFQQIAHKYSSSNTRRKHREKSRSVTFQYGAVVVRLQIARAELQERELSRQSICFGASCRWSVTEHWDAEIIQSKTKRYDILVYINLLYHIFSLSK